MTNSHQIEIVLHVDDTLGKERQQDLLHGLKQHQGIQSAHFTPNRPHLMVVDYDAESIHARDVLGYVKQEHVGAELIGGL